MIKRLGLGLLGVASFAALAFGQGAGFFPFWPVVGGASYSCGSVNNVSNCTVPAGPTTLTGSETIPANASSSANTVNPPPNVLIPSALLSANGQGGFRNLLVGADFGTNLWQRGTTFSAITPTVATMTADRWFAFSTGNTATITRQTGASDIIPTQGLLASMRVSRPSGTDVTPICIGQYLSAKDSEVLVGKNAIFSFYGMAPTTLSSANDSIDVSIAYTTAADSATAGTNTATFALSTTTGYTAVGALNVPLTQTFTRYSTSGAIPSTATSVGVKICFTPLASTGASTDWFEFTGAQLEANLAAITVPGSFARRSQAVENNLQQSYSFVLTDGAVTVRYPGFCFENVANTSALCTVNFPTTMRLIPVTTIATAASFSAQTAAGVANACTALTAVTAGNSNNAGALLCTASGTVAIGLASGFIGAATGALLTFSAEP